MRSSVKATLLIVLGVLAAPVTVSAQIELGVDLGAFIGVSDPKATEITTPVDLRVGFPVGAAAELEPRINFSYFKPSGSDALTSIDAALGLLWHLQNDPARSRIYIRPYGTIRRFSASGNSASQAGVGAGIGVKLASSSDLFWRLEAGFDKRFESDTLFGQSNIFILIGMSYQEK